MVEVFVGVGGVIGSCGLCMDEVSIHKIWVVVVVEVREEDKLRRLSDPSERTCWGAVSARAGQPHVGLGNTRPAGAFLPFLGRLPRSSRQKRLNRLRYGTVFSSLWHSEETTLPCLRYGTVKRPRCLVIVMAQ
ncbi:hypothetical protein O3P69_010643 [Scylla paramamosain]|uniref:Uncharacterized protein n=1 Tax=Scylla paramamosain TaxID=85552 RepID=A0AAW0TFC4_SCYPA